MTVRSCIFTTLLLHVLATPAWADESSLAQPKDPSARLHFTQGNRLYRARKLEEAATEYQAGAALEPAPVFDYNLGQCYRKLGRHADAVRHYERFLESGRPGSELRDLVTGFLRQLRDELARAAPQQPPAAAVSKAPRQAPAAVARTLPGAAAPVSIPGSPAGRSGPASMPAAGLSSSAVPRHAQWHSDRLGWGLVASGVAVAGGAMYLRVRAAGLHDDAGLVPAEDRRVELHDAAQIRGVAGAALAVGSVVLIAAGVIKLAVHAGGPARGKTASWSAGVAGPGIAVLGRF